MDEHPRVEFTSLANFQPKQKEAWFTLMNPNTKYLLYGGSMGPGKSYSLRWSAVGYAMHIFSKYKIRDLPIGLFSKDYPTLRDRQISKISLEFPDWLGKLGETSKWGLSFTLSPAYGNAHILLRNLDDPSKYKSTEFAAEFVEELTENDEEKFRLLKTRLRYPQLEEVKFMGATNPGGIGHGYCKRNFVDHSAFDDERERYAYVHATVYDNKYQTETYIKQLESLPEKEKKMYLFGSWDVFEGQFFSEWNEQVHVCNPFIPTPNALIVGGMDWGRSSRPNHLTAFYAGFDVVEKVFWNDISWYRCKTFLEVTGKDKSPEEWSKEIKDKLKDFHLTLDNIAWVHADTSMFHPKEDGSISISQQFAEADSRWLSLLRPSNKDRIGGWEVMHKWLRIAPDGLPYWRVARNCSHTIRTLPELIHDDVRVEDLDTQGEDHACFCRHTPILTKKGFKPIVEVSIQDLVWTPLGWTKVLELQNNGKHPLVTFRQMKVTSNHPFLIQDGFRQLKDLREMDKLWNVVTSGGNHIGDIQIHQDFPIKSIFAVVQRRMDAYKRNYIETYGNSSMGKFQMGIRFITKIAILIETILRILRYTLLPLILSNIKRLLSKEEEKASILLNKLPNFGMEAMLVSLSINGLEKRHGNIKPNLQNTVLLAESPMKHTFPQNQSFAVLTAKCGCSDVDEVWNLKTEYGMYTAGNALVSNCDGQRYMKIHLSWIDGFAGAVITNQLKPMQKNPTIINDDKEISRVLPAFENMPRANSGGSTRVIGG